MIKILEIPTPENVNLEYELAGLGSRFIAFFVDTLIQSTLLIISYIIIIASELGFADTIIGFESFDSYIIAIGLILAFMILYGYYIFFDMILSGQSPGKKLAKIRVIKQNGEAIGFLDSFIRNILRLVDFLPVFNLLGMAFITFNKDYKRLGDLAANTVVVKLTNEKVTNQPVAAVKASEQSQDELLLRPISSVEYQLLKQVLQRETKMGAKTKAITSKLNKYFKIKFSMTEYPFANEFQFFREIIRQNSES